MNVVTVEAWANTGAGAFECTWAGLASVLRNGLRGAEAEEVQRRAASRWAFRRTLAGDDYLPPTVLGGCSIEALQPCRFV